MPTVVVTKSYSDGNPLTEAELDDIKDSIETALNVTKLDADNIADGGLDADTLASNAVTAVKILTDAVTTIKIQDSAVTTAKINNGAVTSAKLDTNIAVGGTLNVTGTTTTAAISATTISTSGNVTVGDSVSDTLTIGGGSGTAAQVVTSNSHQGLSLTGTSGYFWPGGTAKAGLVPGTGNLMNVENTSGISQPVVTGGDSGSPVALRVLRGVTDGANALTLGEGCTVAKNSTGNYTVTFSTAFASAPAVNITVINGAAAGAPVVSAVAANTCTVLTFNTSGVATDLAFHFHAIGPR